MHYGDSSIGGTFGAHDVICLPTKTPPPSLPSKPVPFLATDKVRLT